MGDVQKMNVHKTGDLQAWTPSVWSSNTGRKRGKKKRRISWPRKQKWQSLYKKGR